MSANRENATLIGFGAAACAVCCAGPILGVLAAIGLGTAVGFALFGTVAIVVGAMLVAFLVIRRRRRAVGCDSGAVAEPERVELTETRSGK
jgi:Na+/melibiose symporter-like transporter